MNWLKGFFGIFTSRLGLKFFLPLFIIVAVMVIPILLYFHYESNADIAAQSALVSSEKATASVAAIDSSVRQEMLDVHEVLLGYYRGGPVNRQFVTDFNAAAAVARSNHQVAAQYASSKSEKDSLSECTALNGQFKAIFLNQVLPLTGRAGANLAPLEGELDGIYNRMLAVHQNLAGSFRADRDATIQSQKAGRKSVESWGFVAAIAGALLGLMAAGMLAKRLLVPIKNMAAGAKKISEGDLKQRVQVKGRDEMARLADSFNFMARSLERQIMKLEQEKTRIRAVHQSINDGIIVVDSTGVIIFTNPAAEAALGRIAAELEESSDTGVPGINEILTSEVDPGRMVKCWEVKACTHPECSSYGSSDLRCWLQCSTHCHNQIQGTFKQKRDACERCDVFYLNAVQTLDVDIEGRHYSVEAVPILDDEGQEDGRTVVLHDMTELLESNKEMKQRSMELAALHEISEAASTSLKLDEVLDAALEKLLAAFDSSAAGIHLLSPSGRDLELVAHSNISPEVQQALRLPPKGSSIAWRVVESREEVIINDVKQEKNMLPVIVAAGYRSAMGVPLVVNEKVIGCLILVSSKPSFYSARDVRLLKLASTAIGVAVENSNLFDDVSRAKSQWEATFDSVSEGIIVVDSGHIIKRMNKGAAAILGGSMSDLVGRECHEVIHAARIVPADCPMSRAVQGLGPMHCEEETGDGRTLALTVDTMFDEAGQVIGAVHFIRDITEIKRMRQQMLQSEKMVAVGQLVSGVAHEINNPLTGVIGYAQLLLSQDLGEKARADAEAIYREAERATKIVRHLLSFARQHTPERMVIDVNAVLKDSIELMAYDMRVNNIKVETSYGNKVPATVADPHQLQQVFLNLIANAEQAMLACRGSGVLKVSTRKAAGMIRVVFADNGPGIPEELHDRVFEPFFTTKDVGKGTGLGLSICYGILEELGGGIWVESGEGPGAALVVELPVVPAPVQVEDEVQPEKPAARLGKVLLVDDEAGIRDVMTETLRSAGHEVDAAGNGEAALKMLKKKDYDCIVSDVKMPGMDGPTLYQEAKRMDQRLGERFIFISGDSVAPKTRTYLSRVGNPCLAKPFNPDDLEEQLQKMLSRIKR